MSMQLIVRTRAGRWLAVGVLALTGLAAQAMDDPPGRVGRVADVQGRAWLQEAGQGEWIDGLRNRPLTSGDRLSTDRDGRLDLQIGSTALQLGAGSELQVLRLDDDRIELMLVAGSLGLRVQEPEVAREIELRAGDFRFLPTAPGNYRIDQDNRSSHGGVATAGELAFQSRDAELSLRAGQRAEFWLDPSDGRTHYSWSTLPADGMAAWLQQPTWAPERRAESRYVSPEMTGADDLDRYGRWADHPEYGALWTPTTVVAGWAPYRYGRWAWVSPWGWTWVDDAPWGFAPFHYGRWVFWGGNWCWAPGRFVRRPAYAPAMVAWVGSPGVSVSVGIGPQVGWVPLAPREVYYPAYRYSPRYLEHVNHPYAYGRPIPPQPPREPVMYSNRGVPGGVTMVPSNALQQRQTVAVMQHRLDDQVVQRAVQSQPARNWRAVTPPAPQGATQAPRVLPTPSAALAVPRSPAPAMAPRTLPSAQERDPYSSTGRDLPSRNALPQAPSRTEPPARIEAPARVEPAVAPPAGRSEPAVVAPPQRRLPPAEPAVRPTEAPRAPAARSPESERPMPAPPTRSLPAERPQVERQQPERPQVVRPQAERQVVEQQAQAQAERPHRHRDPENRGNGRGRDRDEMR